MRRCCIHPHVQIWWYIVLLQRSWGGMPFYDGILDRTGFSTMLWEMGIFKMLCGWLPFVSLVWRHRDINTCIACTDDGLHFLTNIEIKGLPLCFTFLLPELDQQWPLTPSFSMACATLLSGNLVILWQIEDIQDYLLFCLKVYDL